MVTARKVGGSTAFVAKPAGNRGKGRKKGVPNKTTVAVKAALTEAFGEMGGVEALVVWAKADPGEFYKIWAKMLPTEVKGDLNGALTLTMQPGDEKL